MKKNQKTTNPVTAETIARMADRSLGITHYFSVPQMATVIWQHPDFTPEKLQGLRMYVTGGAPNPKAQVERFAEDILISGYVD